MPPLDLALEPDATAVESGELLTYLLTFRNGGDVAIQGLKLTVPLPAGLTPQIASFTATGGSVNLQTGLATWSIASLAPGAEGRVPFTLQVTAAAAPSLAASVHASGTNLCAGDATASTVVKGPGLRVVKTASTSQTCEGPITWTVSVANTGPDARAGLRLVDRVASVFTVAPGSVSPAAEAGPGTLGWALPTLAPGQGVTYSYVTSGPVAASPDDQGQRFGDSADVQLDGVVLATSAPADVRLECAGVIRFTKSFGDGCTLLDAVQPEPVTVSLSWSNPGASALGNVVVRDVVPVPCAQIARPAGMSCSDSTHLLTLSVGALAPLASGSASYTMALGAWPSGRPLLDRAFISATEFPAQASNLAARVPLACVDSDRCTADTCSPTLGCVNTTTPIAGASDETCDGVDDDCDGATDDEFVGAATACGKGVCATVGRTRCEEGHVSDSCAPLPPAAGDDSACNGADDDCDGATDEEYAGGVTSCGVGACAASGVRSCSGGHVVDSCTPGLGGPEVCDGIDNDCDGKVDAADPDLVRVACDKTQGVCAGALRPAALCVGGEWQPCGDAVYLAHSAAYATTDGCDGKDNDCSGASDEDFVAAPTSCGVGECARSGQTTCVAGVVGDSCQPGQAQAETCNGRDDNCDGKTDAADPALVLGLCARQAGVCAGTTQTRELCVNGQFQACPDALYAAHAFPEFAPTATSCDGKDNDCSGATDEDFVVVQTTCGKGVCGQNKGQILCTGGHVADNCDPLAGASAEKCNDLDDDCDGQTDELAAFADKGRGCDGQDADVCKDGVWRCSGDGASLVCDDGPTAGVEQCDGVDNDCNGQTDEGCDDDGDDWCDAGMACVTGGAALAVCPHGCGDCADGDPAVHPGATEVCNGKDDDCAAGTDEGCDDDGDDWCDAAMGCNPAALPAACPRGCGDCSDVNAAVSPGASERCNLVDDDCDEQVDEGYAKGQACDIGIGACTSHGLTVCDSAGDGVVCDAAVVDGAPERCNGKDDDCDGATDEPFQLGVACTSGLGECVASGVLECDPASGEARCSAVPAAGHEEICDGKDNDCDGLTDNSTSSPGVSVCPEVDTAIVVGPDALTASHDAHFEIIDLVTAENEAFECSLDGADWSPCPGGTLDLHDVAVGSHVLLARALGLNDTVDTTPALWRWVVDDSVPETVIYAGPDDPSQSGTASFAFGANVADVDHWMCALDPAGAEPLPEDYEPCDETLTLTGLADGAHALWVYVVDAKGTADPTPETWRWLIDTSAPETAITAGPPALGTATSATFAFRDPVDAEVTRFECRLDGSDWVACDGGTTSYLGLGEGSHLFAVRAVDSAGVADPTPARAQWEIDLSPPDTLVLAKPDDPSQSPDATFAFDSDEDPVTYECALDGAAFAPCGATLVLHGLADGAHTLRVRAIDAVGHVDPTPALATWTVDTRAPETEITAGPTPLAGLGSEAAFSYRDPVTPSHTTFECSLDGAAFVACNGGTTSLGTALEAGPHAFQVRTCDAAKPAAVRCDPTPATWSWQVTPSTCPNDDVAPLVTCAADRSVECVAGGAVVDFAALAPDVFDACLPLTVVRKTPDTLVLGDNPIVFAVTDGNGNLATCATAVEVVDATAPVITCPEDYATENDDGVCGAAARDLGAATVTDACQAAGVLVFDDRPPAFPVGTTLVTYRAVDDAGNEASCQQRVTVRDEEPLKLACSESAVAEAAPDRCDWEGTLTADATDNCAVDVSLIERDGTYPVGVTPVLFTALDAAGNKESCTTRLTVKDVTAPVPVCGTLLGKNPAVVRAGASDACTASAAIRNATCARVTDGGEVLMSSCPFTVAGDALTLDGALDQGTIVIRYDVVATDPSHNEATLSCSITVDGDRDDDGVIDDVDDCIDVPDPDQADQDEDGVGDACDACAAVADATQADQDDDGVGDACDVCPAVADATQADQDEDGVGDACDVCPSVADADQADGDGNHIGDACQDSDQDGILDGADNCPLVANADQADLDRDQRGDACDDDNGDGLEASGTGGCGAAAGDGVALGLVALGLALGARRRAGAGRAAAGGSGGR
ncbi:MAG: MopE-related protein [Myxococcota bacterium]